MKQCPQCYRQYPDNSLEFCLEDGTPLRAVQQLAAEETYLLKPVPPTLATPKNAPLTEVLPHGELAATRPAELPSETIVDSFLPVNSKTTVIKEKALTQGAKILEVVPIVFALAQNYWQWLYFSSPADFEFPKFLWSTNFIVWLILLSGGAGLSLAALRYTKNKGFAIVSLVILAINLLLCIVPRRN